MSSQEDIIEVDEEVKQLVSDIIVRYNFKRKHKIRYYPGSQVGDGYLSKTFAVDITDDETSLNLFLKRAIDIDEKIPFAYLFYSTEIFFYKRIYPTYNEFLKSKGVKDGFRNAPICYGFNETRRSEIIALENLRKKGFTLFDRFSCMNDEHLRLFLQTLAKFHATSFAIKDQRKGLHEEFCASCPNLFSREEVIPKEVYNAVKDFIEKLDPIEDKDILDRCDNLPSKVSDRYLNMDKYLTDYSILTKGDCWVNNMMVLYENDNTEHPKDVMLVDWQGMARISPVHDFGALFYSVASKETVDNYKYYLKVYHEELSKRIKELGSDPEVLYPRSVLEKEWIDYGLCSFGMCVLVIKGMLTDSKHALSFENSVENEDLGSTSNVVTYDEKNFLRRTKYVVRHMIDIGIL